MDFDIANYDLEELLSLFELPYDFGEPDLKRAKLIALRLHPDKSGLEKEYFLFFKRAYTMISELYSFRRKTTQGTTESQAYTVEVDQEKELLLKKVKKKKNFHKWFNEMFEKSDWHRHTMERGTEIGCALMMTSTTEKHPWETWHKRSRRKKGRRGL